MIESAYFTVKPPDRIAVVEKVGWMTVDQYLVCPEASVFNSNRMDSFLLRPDGLHDGVLN